MYFSLYILFFFFFFQAEDGIRDATVTGVQTCALPISSSTAPTCAPDTCTRCAGRGCRTRRRCAACRPAPGAACRERRSEERRVGKECGSRGGAEHEKKKKQHKTSVGVGQNETRG